MLVKIWLKTKIIFFFVNLKQKRRAHFSLQKVNCWGSTYLASAIFSRCAKLYKCILQTEAIVRPRAHLLYIDI